MSSSSQQWPKALECGALPWTAPRVCSSSCPVACQDQHPVPTVA
ncbi:hypothetical protein [Amycolatopsis sp. MEPSY49]